MTIETLNKRISGKKAEIAKLEAKLGRIQKAKASGWQVNPYYYSDSDERYTERDIEAARTALLDYERQLEAETEKAGSRNIPVITEFLEKWKASAVDFFRKQKKIYDEVARPEYYQREHEYCEMWNSGKLRRMDKAERTRYENEYREFKRKFVSEWAHVTQFTHGERSWEENLERDLEIEKNRKYDFIIERTNAAVGQITDASNLYIGAKGDLNGFIIGTKGKAEVRTIGAGGYNIQCFHFRTLINKIK